MKSHLNYILALALLTGSSFHPVEARKRAAGGAYRPAIEAGMRAALKQVETLAAAEYAKHNRGGMTLAVVSGSRIVWAKSYGFADSERHVAAGAATVYRIGGTTLKFTALMLLQLVEKGQVRLDDPVEKYFPEVNQLHQPFTGASPITLYQLATHTSGIAFDSDRVAEFGKGAVARWETQLIAALPSTKYIARPGARFAYSNIGYAILGAALSRACGESYVGYVRRHIFVPLGMKHTAFEPNALISRNLAKGYVIAGAQVDTLAPEREHQGRGYKVPNGAVYTTAGDLSKFVAFELGGGPSGVLRRDSLRNNYRRIINVTAADAPRDMAGYGIGFQVMRYGDFTFLGHGGAVPGYHARADFDPQTGIGFVVLRNIEGGEIHLSTLRLVQQSLSLLSSAGVSSKTVSGHERFR